MIAAQDLVALVRNYNPKTNAELIEAAYDYGRLMHDGQFRHSGEPYFTHPVAVAAILTEQRLDDATIITALLHDTIEDTKSTYSEITERFGQEVADLVDGVTKLTNLQLSSTETKQAENFRKLFIAMSKDLRVILVKLADRLHNMRTIKAMRPEKQAQKARETMEIFAPLAGRMGMQWMREELEDLSFRVLNPEGRASIMRRFVMLHKEAGDVVHRITGDMRNLLEKQEIEAEVFGRAKKPYSIWRKMQAKDQGFSRLSDIYGFRIITESEEDCYRALGAIHQRWRAVPGRFKDYISQPKSNGYRSIHTTVSGRDGRRVEVQIRTRQMHDVAETGVAAHWSYRDGVRSGNPFAVDPAKWLASLTERFEEDDDHDAFLEAVKLEMYTDKVFCFTPKGEVIKLPKGATPLDFAYALHTDIGDTCIGAIINSRQRPLRTQLQNLDVVKVIRGGQPEPQPDWENMVVTGKARSALRRLTRDGKDQEFIRLGTMMVEHAFARAKLDFSGSSLKDALTRLPHKTAADLFKALGEGSFSIKELMGAVFPGRNNDNVIEDYANREFISDDTAKLYVKGDGLTAGVSLHFANCCSPIPGDRIVGVQSGSGRGIIIHTIDCEVLVDAESEADNWLDIGWRRTAEHAASTGRITATLEHVPGALADVTRIIGEAGGNLTSIKTLKRSTTFFDMIMVVDVRDNRHLSQIIAAMRASSYVVAAHRTRAAMQDTES